jgi:hypothetical protein
VASLVLNESMHIGVEFPLVFLHNGWDIAMGTKNNVIECLCVTHNFVYNVMITERILDYCVDRISPRYPNPPPASERLNARSAINTIQAQRSMVW